MANVKTVNAQEFVTVPLKHHLTLDVLRTVETFISPLMHTMVISEMFCITIIFNYDIYNSSGCSITQPEIRAVRGMMVRWVELAQIVADWELSMQFYFSRFR